ncbi:zinc-dependent metalloproteinase lipoprotein [Butyricimonas hominis]|uniref:zinc-dependent metalloproteinase lipoprotein n=1 Tax=Butyricimonas TaxID=574697 RepID=UPI00351722F3
MKKLIYWTLFLVVLAACSKDKFEGIELSTGNDIQFSSEKQTIRIGIRSSSDWVISNSTSWCDPSKISSPEGDTLVLSAKVNTSTDQRSGTITLANSDHKINLNITQNGEHYFELPVIFHVLYTNASDSKQNIPGDSIRKYMNYVNAFYRNDNGKSQNLNLEFTLATTDPEGNPMTEPGIHRVQQSLITYNIEDYLNNKHNGTELIWNPNNYINIIICTFTEKNVTGISVLPYTPQGKPLPGLSRHDAYYTSLPTNSVQAIMINNMTISEKDIGPESWQPIGPLTIAHELGHYLGLFHVFSGGDNGQLTDYCEDTPDYDRTEYEKMYKVLWEQRVSREGVRFTSTNIMDYYVGYRDRFTSDQRARIRHVLDYSPLIPGPKITVRSSSRAVPITEEPKISR